MLNSTQRSRYGKHCKIGLGVVLILLAFTGFITMDCCTPATEQGYKYWLNSGSNVRHNSSCRWYGNTKEGYYTDKKVGDPCGICRG